VRPLLLLPPSKGKADGGGEPTYGDAVERPHALRDARREVLAAAEAAAPGLDDATAARVCGVRRAEVDDARDRLATLRDAPTLPAHRRYTGIVHGNAGLADLDPYQAGADVVVVSPLLGLAALEDPVPAYRLELAVTLPGFGGLATWWRRRLADHLGELGADRRVWDLLPGEHERAIDPDARAGWDVVDVRFLRPDGRTANAARTKVCKGRLVAALLDDPSLTPDGLARTADPGPGWRLAADGGGVTATYHG
jgi:uncharacterized protein